MADRDMTNTTLTTAIIALHNAMAYSSAEAVEAAIDAASDELLTGDRSDDMVTEAILDGLRWGHHAAGVVELGGGTIVRVIVPGGVRVTHEWHGRASEDCRDHVMETVGRALAGGPA